MHRGRTSTSQSIGRSVLVVAAVGRLPLEDQIADDAFFQLVPGRVETCSA